MKKRFLSIALLVVAVVVSSCSGSKYKVGETYNGFKLEKKEFVQEMNCDVLQFKHTKSGARLLKVAANDDNKLFSITFFTTPNDDSGVPHILEHSVLNGSEHFPVKSPFDVLIKGSLNTFLNAMTGSDLTTYPVASMNEKDYFNLMHVYLDAVLFPNLRTDDRIMKQEGWHYELNDINEEVTIKGVVYNEMKGSFSSPTSELNYVNNKVLFPDNTYGVSSGGYPQAIPTLTQEKFVAFHQQYYHPSNSFILLYGDANLDKELAFIDSEYLSKFDDNGMKTTVEPQKPFEAKKELVATYNMPEGSATKDNTYLTYSVVTGSGTDAELSMGLELIADAMVNHETAPLRLALRNAGIGKDVYAYASNNLQNVFQIMVINANPEDKDKFNEIVESTMAKVAAEGLDADAVEGLLNRKEFRLREGNTPHKGLMSLFSVINSMWYNAQDPIAGLRFEEPIAKIKEGIKGTLLQDIVKNNLIGNPHTLLTVMKPEVGKEAKIVAQTRKELAEYKKSLSKEQLEQLVADTKALVEYQKESDKPEDVAKVPMLQLADISPEVQYYQVEEKSIADVKTLHFPEYTNNIVYANLYFDLKAIPQEMIPYAELLSTIIGDMSTETYTYGELQNAMNKHTGGVYTSVSTRIENDNDSKLIPQFVITGKSTIDKCQKMIELTGEIVNKTKYSDIERLKELITRHQASVEMNVKNDGRGIATTRMMSYYSPSAMFNELTNGLEYYNFITGVKNKFETNSQEVIDNLNKVAQMIFTKKNLILGVTCSNENMATFNPAFTTFVSTLPEGDGKTYDWNFNYEVKNEGLMSASKVQYVIQGYNFKELGYEWNGKIRVLNQVLSREYLHNTVRVQGGAYGGYSSFSSSGNALFASYRDPNLKETLDNYAGAPEFLKKFDVDDVEMTRFIIGTISGMQGPTTPSSRGNMAIGNYFSKRTKAQMMADRKDVLSTTKEDIRSFEKMVSDILAKNVYCVFGSDAKIQDNKALFKNVYNVVK